MSIANWKTQAYNNIQSLLFNNAHRVVRFEVRDDEGKVQSRADRPAPVRRLFETDTPPDRTCLETIQFVHHVLIPPQGRHVVELHVHPDAEELIVITRGSGTAFLGGQRQEVTTGDVIYVAPHTEHELRNTQSELLGALFINVPVGEGLKRLVAEKEAG